MAISITDPGEKLKKNIVDPTGQLTTPEEEVEEEVPSPKENLQDSIEGGEQAKSESEGKSEEDKIKDKTEEQPDVTQPFGPKPPTVEQEDIAPELKKATQNRMMAEQNSFNAKRSLAKAAIDYQGFLANAPKMFEQRREMLSNMMAKAEKRISSPPPVKASLVNSGSLGETIFHIALNMASGGGYLKGLKSAYSREIQAYKLNEDHRSKVMGEYISIGEMYKDNEMGFMAFQKDALGSITTIMESQLKAETDPIKQQLLIENLEKARTDNEINNEELNLKKKELEGFEAKKAIEAQKQALKAQLDKSTIAKNYATIAEKQAKTKELEVAKPILLEKTKIGNDLYIGSVSKDKDIIDMKSTYIEPLKSSMSNSKKSLEYIEKFRKENLATIGNRLKLLKSKGALSIGMGSKEDQRFVGDLRKFGTYMNTYFASAKEILGLDRLSDKDVGIVKEFLGVYENNHLSSTGYLTKDKLNQMITAIGIIDDEMKEKAYSVSVSKNANGEVVDRKLFLSGIEEEVFGKKKKATPQRKVFRAPAGNSFQSDSDILGDIKGGR